MMSTEPNRPADQEQTIGSTLLEMVTRFYEGIFTESSAEERVPSILSEAARVFEADIATWFLVTEDRTQLRLVDVYNDLKRAATVPAQPYTLNWDAESEENVEGLTAWTAISGRPLHVPSLESLIGEHRTAHAGRWDRWLYPEGIRNERSGFLCMYAVPLLLPIKGSPRENVVGVLKMERRKMKGDILRKEFTKADLDSFNIIARIIGFAYFHSERQKSLTLADIGHALIRPLGDVAFALDVVSAELADAPPELRQSQARVEAATTMLRSLSGMLSLAKESHNQPLQHHEVDVRADLCSHLEAFTLTSGRKVIDRSKGTLEPIRLTRRSHAALVNIAINLVDNATRNSPMHSEVTVRIDRSGAALLLVVENPGEAISGDIMNDAMALPDAPTRFKGLPRSYQLATRNGWTLTYKPGEGVNRFDLTVPYPFEDGA